MFQTKVVDKIKSHVLRLVTFFFAESRAIYQIMWKNMVESDRLQVTIRLMHFAWCIRLQTHTRNM